MTSLRPDRRARHLQIGVALAVTLGALSAHALVDASASALHLEGGIVQVRVVHEVTLAPDVP